MKKETKVREMLESFINGLEKEKLEDITNAALIGNELLGLELSVEFNGACRDGVLSYQISGHLHFIRPNQNDKRSYEIGKHLSKYSSRELAFMALYLWNEGRSALYEGERIEARELLKREFDYSN